MLRITGEQFRPPIRGHSSLLRDEARVLRFCRGTMWLTATTCRLNRATVFDVLVRHHALSLLRLLSIFGCLDDILDFAASTLVDGGRLCMWMPVAGSAPSLSPPASESANISAAARQSDQGNHADAAPSDEEAQETEEYSIPAHPCLELVTTCRQDFNKWSRRLLTYRRLPVRREDAAALAQYEARRQAVRECDGGAKRTADDLNDFRRRYFEGFREQETGAKAAGIMDDAAASTTSPQRRTTLSSAGRSELTSGRYPISRPAPVIQPIGSASPTDAIPRWRPSGRYWSGASI